MGRLPRKTNHANPTENYYFSDLLGKCFLSSLLHSKVCDQGRPIHANRACHPRPLFNKFARKETSLSTLIHLFKWNLKKLIRSLPERKLPDLSPFSFVCHRTSFVMVTRQMKSACPSQPKEEGKAILTVDSFDSQICVTQVLNRNPCIRNECVRNDFIAPCTSQATLTDDTSVPVEFIPNQQHFLARDFWKVFIGISLKVCQNRSTSCSQPKSRATPRMLPHLSSTNLL